MALEKILIVEDETIVSENIKNILSKLNYTVSGVVTSGEEVIQTLSQTKPDLVLMDIKLKGEIDGIEAAEEIRSQFDIPVIYLTAFVDDHILKRAKITEPSGYIIKPFEILDLRTTIEIALHKHRIDKRIRFSHRLLKIANQSDTIPKMVKQFLSEVKEHTKYTAAGIRLLDENGHSPYMVSDNFPKSFITAESKFPLNPDPKTVILSTTGKKNSDFSHTTKTGSVIFNDIKGYIASAEKTRSNRIHDLYDRYNYQSAARIPIIVGETILGLLHVVSSQKNWISLETLELLEKGAMQLGIAVKRMQVEKTLNQHRSHLEELVEERTSALKKTNRKLQKEISERKKTEEELFNSQSSFHNIVEKSGEGIIVLDNQAVVRFINPTAKKFLGHISKRLIGKPFPYIPINGQSDEIIINLQKDMTGIGEIRTISTKWEGEKAHLVTIRDITERKKIEQTKSDFVSLVSHQLKTPVAEIKEFTDIMLKGLAGNFSEKQKMYLQEMHEISARNFRLIATLLDVSRIERKVISVHLSTFDIDEIICSVIKEYEDSIKQKKLTLKYASNGKMISVLADRDKLVEAFSNVLDNALKFTDKGSITIQTGIQHKFGFIKITDTGTGINGNIRNKLFQKDQILYGGPSTQSGCGLGLYIAREFLRLQNGDIFLDSTSKQGSCFILKIPLASKV